MNCNVKKEYIITGEGRNCIRVFENDLERVEIIQGGDSITLNSEELEVVIKSIREIYSDKCEILDVQL